ncbi:integrase [Kibdelosporangium philippinense]
MFAREYAVDQCAGCGRWEPVRSEYCRLCWAQARVLARESGRPLHSTGATAVRFLQQVRHHQLFFADMQSTRGASTSPPRKHPRRGRPRTPDPAPAGRPVTRWAQPVLFPGLPRDYTRFDETMDANPDNPWLRWGQHVACQLAERRGWPRRIRLDVERSLIILLSHHIDDDTVSYVAMFTALRPLGLSCDRTADVLNEMGLLVDDRRPAFEDWLEGKLDGIAPGIARETETWLRNLRNGGPRTRPRDIHTVRQYARAVRPILLDWSANYDHLREVTRENVLEALAPLRGRDRQHTLIVLRSMFGFCKKNGVVFRNPTSRIRVGDRHSKNIQPLRDDQVQRTVAAAARPADRLIIALAAIHAARSGAIRALRLDDVDLGDRRLIIAGRLRPLDDLTHKLLLDWLDYRRTRWPTTANPHLLVNQMTALKLGPVSGFWIKAGFRGQEATLERLRVDRQLEEALTHGPDPLHLAVVFGLDERTAIRYAASARQLLETAIECDTSG